MRVVVNKGGVFLVYQEMPNIMILGFFYDGKMVFK
jgi:hypothetical protein